MAPKRLENATPSAHFEKTPDEPNLKEMQSHGQAKMETIRGGCPGARGIPRATDGLNNGEGLCVEERTPGISCMRQCCRRCAGYRVPVIGNKETVHAFGSLGLPPPLPPRPSTGRGEIDTSGRGAQGPGRGPRVLARVPGNGPWAPGTIEPSWASSAEIDLSPTLATWNGHVATQCMAPLPFRPRTHRGDFEPAQQDTPSSSHP